MHARIHIRLIPGNNTGNMRSVQAGIGGAGTAAINDRIIADDVIALDKDA